VTAALHEEQYTSEIYK